MKVLISISSSRFFLFFVSILFSFFLSAPKAHASSFWSLCNSLFGKVSAQKNLEAAFKPYFEEGDPEGWKKLIDKTISETGGLVGLGGNDANTHSLFLPNGDFAVIKSFSSNSLENHKRVLDQLLQWEKEGIGPRIIGISLLPGLKSSERRFLLVMEDLMAKRNPFGKTLLSGTGRDVGALKKESVSSRRWIRDRMLSLLATHSDPHPMNIIFRVTQIDSSSALPPPGTYHQENGKIYQAFLIDPSGAKGDPENPIFNTPISETAFPMLQYNHEWKKKYFDEALGF